MTRKRRLAGLLVLAVGACILLLAAYGLTTPTSGRAAPQANLPGDSVHLVALGTSLTANGVWPDAVAQNLSECLGRPVTLTRLARAGARSDWGATRLDELLALRPDLVLIEFTVNDSDLVDGLWPWQSQANHAAILSGIREADNPASVWLVETGPTRGVRAPVRVLRPVYRRMAYDLADRYGAGVIDLNPAWKAYLSEQGGSAALPDGLHPSSQAQHSIAVPEIVGAIAGAAGQGC